VRKQTDTGYPEIRTNMLTIIKGDDWEGLYDDSGTLVAEGHSLTYSDLADALGIVISERRANIAWLEDNGRLPKRLSDVIDEDAEYP
jgi:hypothetical protein